jgi:aminopeptidase N
MEYPMMINQGGGDVRVWMVHTAVHEAGHMYFPFYMGINERKYAWMDEGMTQFVSEAVQFAIDDSIDFRARNVFRYLYRAGSDYDVPLMTPSIDVNNAYGHVSYFKPCIAYNILRDFLGEELFKKCLVEYMKRWNGRHPVPYDFFYTFNEISGQDLSWFWKSWFFETGYPDIAIKDVQQSGDKIRIVIERIGSLPVPVAMTLNTAEDTELLVYRKADVWRDGANEITIEEKVNDSITEIKLGTKYIPDVDEKDNLWVR